jgi:thioesterase domain-containing protein
MASFYKGEIKKFQPKGPYQFIGFCFNNAICIELAYLLASEGDQVQLFIIDSAPPAKKLSIGKRVMNLAKQGGFKLIARKLKQKLASNPPNKSLVDDLAIYDKMPSLAKHYYKLYQKYERKAFKAEVILLRSSQNVNIPGKISHVRNWAELAINGIKQEVVEGDHRDLFNEPEVQELAQKISKHLF